MRAASIFGVGAATGAVATALILGYSRPGAQLASSPVVAPADCAQAAPVSPACEERAGASAPPASPPLAAPTPPRDADPQQDAIWTALVEGMLEAEVQRRFGEKLDPRKKARLLAELARLREASLGLQRVPDAPAGPEQLRERLTHQVALLEVDRVFREELGVGVSEFLQGLDVDAVDDVSRARPPR